MEYIVRVGVFVNTPAQVHFYKNIISVLRERGNDIYLLARDYGETIALLNEMNLEHYIYSRPPNSKYGKVFMLPFDVIKAYNYLKKLDIDIVTGFGTYDAYTSTLLRVPSVSFNDSEPSANNKSYAIQLELYLPFVAVLITPDSFRQDMGSKHVRISAYKEMAYLHPKYYQPRDNIFDLLGLERGDEYAILRFNAFDAVHDYSIKGFNDEEKIELVKRLDNYIKVFISSEAGIPKELKRYLVRIPKSRIHDALYYAKLLVTDTQTMATEGAILGTPTIRCNKFVGENDMGNFIELEKKYHLMFNYSDPKEAINKAIELSRSNELKQQWQKRRKGLIEEKIDLVKFMAWVLENYQHVKDKTNLVQLFGQYTLRLDEPDWRQGMNKDAVHEPTKSFSS